MPCSNYFQLKGNNKQEKLLGFSSSNYNAMYRDIQMYPYLYYVYTHLTLELNLYTLEYLQKNKYNTFILLFFLLLKIIFEKLETKDR